MYHLLEHKNQGLKRRESKDKDSTVNKAEYRIKRNPADKVSFPPNYNDATFATSYFSVHHFFWSLTLTHSSANLASPDNMHCFVSYMMCFKQIILNKKILLNGILAKHCTKYIVIYLKVSNVYNSNNM